ncbi:MAG TPA: response regulator transcription factor [Burkholderiales bacterium]|jgi:two-component system OmpR family response regulator|nr:response regulator transcription factor [Burkholderiales bacterium]
MTDPLQVLIVEDDAVLADGLVRYLQQAGYRTEVVTNGTDADLQLRSDAHDLVVLDIGLPGLDGYEVLRRLRARAGRPRVLMLTARDAVEDRVHGLDLGADDYLVKPFSLQELEARLRAIARRHEDPANKQLHFGPLKLNTEAKRAWIENEPLRLTVREWQILEFLVTRAGHMVSKDQIVFGLASLDDEMSHTSVEVHISHLRQKLEPAGIRIRSIRGFGYYLEK